MRLTSLPYDVLVLVASHSDSFNTLRTLRLTCRLFAGIYHRHTISLYRVLCSHGTPTPTLAPPLRLLYVVANMCQFVPPWPPSAPPLVAPSESEKLPIPLWPSNISPALCLSLADPAHCAFLRTAESHITRALQPRCGEPQPRPKDGRIPAWAWNYLLALIAPAAASTWLTVYEQWELGHACTSAPAAPRLASSLPRAWLPPPTQRAWPWRHAWKTAYRRQQPRYPRPPYPFRSMYVTCRGYNVVCNLELPSSSPSSTTGPGIEAGAPGWRMLPHITPPGVGCSPQEVWAHEFAASYDEAVVPTRDGRDFLLLLVDTLSYAAPRARDRLPLGCGVPEIYLTVRDFLLAVLESAGTAHGTLEDHGLQDIPKLPVEYSLYGSLDLERGAARWEEGWAPAA